MANCLNNVQKHGNFLDFWRLVLGKIGIFYKVFEKELSNDENSSQKKNNSICKIQFYLTF